MEHLWLIVILRILHIFFAVFWTGSMIYLAAFVLPAMNASGPEGGKFMQQLMRTNKLPLWLTIAGTVTVLAGLWMMDMMSHHFTWEWFTGHYGMSLLIGGIAGILAFLVGFIINRPAAFRMGKLAEEIAAAGGPPTPGQAAEIAKLRQKIAGGTRIIAVLLVIAVIFMAIARYI